MSLGNSFSRRSSRNSLKRRSILSILLMLLVEDEPEPKLSVNHPIGNEAVKSRGNHVEAYARATFHL